MRREAEGGRRSKTGRRGSAGLIAAVAMLSALTLWSPRAEAIEFWQSDDGMQIIEFTPSLKLFFFGAAGFPDIFTESYLTPELGGGTLMRLRLRFSADITSRIRFVVHYEHRPRVLSDGTLLSAASGSLQGDETVPLRLTPMVWELATYTPTGSPEPTFAWEHEIDWLFFSFAIPGGIDLVVGRQAVSWGVSRFWSPMDVFAPLTATDLDREERRGIDAIKLTFSMGAASLMEIVLAGGTEPGEDGDEITWDASSLAWMLRINQLGIDWMLMAGKIGTDLVFGGAIAGQLNGVALRGEVTGVVDEQNEAYARATVGLEFGTSFNLTGIIEYHYNGFGVLDPADYLSLAMTQQSRISRGQVAGMGQHYAGVTLVYTLPLLTISLLYIQNLTDGSLTLGPSVMYSLADNVSISFSGYIPIGRDPRGTSVFDMEARSEYGMSPQLYMVQLKATL